MFHRNKLFKTINNNHGFGLIAAIFVVVILAVFGLLVARFTGTGALESAEDYLWAQALYSTQSGAQLRILSHDGGGGPLTPWPGSYPDIANFTIDDTFPETNLQPSGNPSRLRIQADRAGLNISRVIEVKYIL